MYITQFGINSIRSIPVTLKITQQSCQLKANISNDLQIWGLHSSGILHHVTGQLCLTPQERMTAYLQGLKSPRTFQKNKNSNVILWNPKNSTYKLAKIPNSLSPSPNGHTFIADVATVFIPWGYGVCIMNSLQQLMAWGIGIWCNNSAPHGWNKLTVVPGQVFQQLSTHRLQDSGTTSEHHRSAQVVMYIACVWRHADWIFEHGIHSISL